MSDFIADFMAGALVGGMLGMLAMALCAASGRASRIEDGWVMPVHCRDCKHYETDDYTCRLNAYAWEKRVPGFYCASGEREQR